MSENLLWRWRDVADVGAELAALVALNLSRNRFSDDPDPGLLGLRFANLRSLVLNDLGYDWARLMAVARGLPRLECMHVADNKITQVI